MASLVVCAPSPADEPPQLPPGALARITHAGEGERRERLDSVREVLFSPDSRWLAIRGEPADPTTPRVVHLWDVARQKDAAALGGPAPIGNLSYSSNGKWLAGAAPNLANGVQVWSIPGGQANVPFPSGRGKAVFLPDTEQLALLAPAGKNEVVRWHLAATGEETRRFVVPVTYLAEFSPDGATLAATARFGDATPRLIDVSSGKELRKLAAGRRQPTTIRFAPNGRTLLVATPEEGVGVWEVATGELVMRIKPPSTTLSVAMTGDDRLLALGGTDGVVRRFDVATGAEHPALRGHSRPVATVAFSPDGMRLASGGLDRTVLLWDATSALPAEPALERLADDVLARLWDDLGATSASASYRALRHVRQTSDTTWPWLIDRARRQLLPPERGRIDQLLRDLDAPDSLVRHRATEELKTLRELARPALTALAKKSPSAEVRWRARRLLQWGDRTPRFLDSDLRRFHRLLHAIDILVTDPNAGVAKDGSPALALVDLIVREIPDESVRRNAQRTLQRLKPTSRVP